MVAERRARTAGSRGDVRRPESEHDSGGVRGEMPGVGEQGQRRGEVRADQLDHQHHRGDAQHEMQPSPVGGAPGRMPVPVTSAHTCQTRAHVPAPSSNDPSPYREVDAGLARTHDRDRRRPSRSPRAAAPAHHDHRLDRRLAGQRAARRHPRAAALPPRLRRPDRRRVPGRPGRCRHGTEPEHQPIAGRRRAVERRQHPRPDPATRLGDLRRDLGARHPARTRRLADVLRRRHRRCRPQLALHRGRGVEAGLRSLHPRRQRAPGVPGRARSPARRRQPADQGARQARRRPGA